jgi:hypothetical protein
LALLFPKFYTSKILLENLSAEIDSSNRLQPQFAPFRCPVSVCTFEAKDLKMLVRHYGVSHKMVVKLLNERSGNHDSFDEAVLKTFETQVTAATAATAETAATAATAAAAETAACDLRPIYKNRLQKKHLCRKNGEKLGWEIAYFVLRSHPGWGSNPGSFGCR